MVLGDHPIACAAPPAGPRNPCAWPKFPVSDAYPLWTPIRLESTFEGFRYITRCLPHASAEPPVLFISGAFQSMGSWKKFADHFSRFRTVVLCDLPGTGEADPLPSRFGLDFLACALANVLGELGIPTVDIVSASYGHANRLPVRADLS